MGSWGMLATLVPYTPR